MSGLFKSPLRAAARFPRDRDRDREKKKQRPSCFSPVCARARTCKRKQIPGTFRSTGASHVRERARQPQRFANCRLRPREISSASAILISGRRYRRARLLLPPPPLPHPWSLHRRSNRWLVRQRIIRLSALVFTSPARYFIVNTSCAYVLRRANA